MGHDIKISRVGSLARIVFPSGEVAFDGIETNVGVFPANKVELELAFRCLKSLGRKPSKRRWKPPTGRFHLRFDVHTDKIDLLADVLEHYPVRGKLDWSVKTPLGTLSVLDGVPAVIENTENSKFPIRAEVVGWLEPRTFSSVMRKLLEKGEVV